GVPAPAPRAGGAPGAVRRDPNAALSRSAAGRGLVHGCSATAAAGTGRPARRGWLGESGSSWLVPGFGLLAEGRPRAGALLQRMARIRPPGAVLAGSEDGFQVTGLEPARDRGQPEGLVDPGDVDDPGQGDGLGHAGLDPA